MCNETTLQNKSGRGSRLRLGLLLVGLLATGAAAAQGNERLGPFLRQYAAPQDRQGREMPAFSAEPVRRQDVDENRNPRRWSPEERRQLRRDVHDAGRDVYGDRHRRPD
ncbi:MAG: hypothetical protein EKK49_09480 [Rhodocyclaceae bacterium]|nr:MAG: hypothetical protein EKK49_09480 [Rhodocyclaceae bacterium]